MADVILTIDIDDALAQAYFDYAGYKVQDLRFPFSRIRDEVVIPAIKEALASEGESIGEYWQELSAAYEARKFADGYGGRPILERTGLAKIVLTEIKTNRIWRITRDSLEFRDMTSYMGFHQTGAGNNPQRVWLDITPEDEMQIEGIMEEWLDDLRSSNRRRGGADEAFSPPGSPNVNVLGFDF